MKLGLVSLLVDDYDRAIEYYTETLGFTLIEDTVINSEKRWVVLEPPDQRNEINNNNNNNFVANHGARILLARASNAEQIAHIGNQTGGRVFLFLETDDFWRDYNLWKERGVQFLEEPRQEAYGVVVVFCDIFGNKWDLIGPQSSSSTLDG